MGMRENVESAIRTARDAAAAGREALIRVAQAVTETAAEENARGHEGIARWYAEAGDRLSQAASKIDSSTALCEAAAAEVARTDDGASLRGSGGLPRQPATPATEQGRPRAIPGFTHRRPAKEAIDAIKREGWPKTAEGRTSARGHLYNPDGNRLDTGTLRPHRKGAALPCTDLREPWRSDPNYTTTWHAERDAAKIMRDNNLREAVLYLNIPPCGRYTEDPKRCDLNLEKILPKGATLWVWTISETGSRGQRRYRGTGEAIT
ncbi:DddA-like double-stranded DNA deaminase toxin [Stackebrandtia endophytica]|nr:DddA-like double-stranded DNA deaminase toxin [Stackebrandtia endophytica]